MKQYNFVTEVASDSNPNRKYKLKMDECGVVSCNCMSWINNTRRTTPRTCKHTDKIINAGFQLDGEGKFLVAEDNWGRKVPMFCKNYPAKCDDCTLRFMCYTELSPEFTTEQLKDRFKEPVRISHLPKTTMSLWQKRNL